jgi:predicted GIY-YIG superfamily endonuclease
MWFVYVLECNNGDFYKGCTSNLEERLDRHQKGRVESTKNFLPVKLITYIAFQDQTKAYDFEKYLKSGLEELS